MRIDVPALLLTYAQEGLSRVCEATAKAWERHCRRLPVPAVQDGLVLPGEGPAATVDLIVVCADLRVGLKTCHGEIVATVSAGDAHMVPALLLDLSGDLVDAYYGDDLPRVLAELRRRHAP